MTPVTRRTTIAKANADTASSSVGQTRLAISSVTGRSVDRRAAEVEHDRAADEAPVLDVERLVQPE